jgi:hypothetical protein
MRSGGLTFKFFMLFMVKKMTILKSAPKGRDEEVLKKPLLTYEHYIMLSFSEK